MAYLAAYKLSAVASSCARERHIFSLLEEIVVILGREKGRRPECTAHAQNGNTANNPDSNLATFVLRNQLSRYSNLFCNAGQLSHILRAEYLRRRVRPSGKGRLYDLEYRTERDTILSDFFAQQPFDDRLRLQLNPTATFPALRLMLKERKEKPLFSASEKRLGEQFLLHCLS